VKILWNSIHIHNVKHSLNSKNLCNRILSSKIQ